MNNIKRIAVIPARGGSKRIPGKNIRDFCGKPMILHTLNSAAESSLFDEIHVSTDSDVITEIVNQAGFETRFKRPGFLADDKTPIMPVLKYVLEEFEKIDTSFDQVWMLMACSPLVQADDYIKAAELLDTINGERPLLAVTEYPAPVEWAFSLSKKDGILTPANPGMFATRSQDIKNKYFDAGAFSVFPPEQIKVSQGAGSDTNFMGYILDRSRVVDIDDEDDWKFAESLFNSRSNKS